MDRFEKPYCGRCGKDLDKGETHTVPDSCLSYLAKRLSNLEGHRRPERVWNEATQSWE